MGMDPSLWLHLIFSQILNLPFFLGINIMGDNHATSSTYSMNPVANNLYII
jgi:hypothetical protein